MPREYRQLAVGAFTTFGKPPQINDARVTWHIGDAEKTIGNINFDPNRSHKLIIFFDFDLFEPSYLAWLKIFPSLKSGDLLYFDEAFDPSDERKLLSEHILPCGDFKFIAATHIALALEVSKIRSSPL